MENNILNSEPLQVFVIIAETLAGWKNPMSDEGKAVLMKHYEWGAGLKANGHLILAGPVDFDLIAAGKINAIGHTTGIIMLKAASREEAEELAHQDPFHTNGYRKNVVHSMKITMTNDDVFKTITDVLLKVFPKENIEFLL